MGDFLTSFSAQLNRKTQLHTERDIYKHLFSLSVFEKIKTPAVKEKKVASQAELDEFIVNDSDITESDSDQSLPDLNQTQEDDLLL